MRTTTLTVLLIALLATTSIACKKNKVDAIKKNYLLTNINTNNINSVITYNNDGKIASSNSAITTSNFLYRGNTILKTNLEYGNFNSKAIITIEINGSSSNVQFNSNISEASFTNIAYNYYGNELLKPIQTSSSKTTSNITHFTFSGGILVSIKWRDHNYA